MFKSMSINLVAALILLFSAVGVLAQSSDTETVSEAVKETETEAVTEEKGINPKAKEIAQAIGSTSGFIQGMGRNAQEVVKKVRETFPALKPEAAEALASNYIDLVIEKISPKFSDIQADVFSQLFTEDELELLAEFTGTAEGAEIIHKLPGVMNAVGVLIGRETQNDMRAILREALEKTEEQGHVLNYGQ